jgi:DNA mismatch repair protein MSH6
MATKMHVGFPEKRLDHYAGLLVKFGFKICIVEQTETPREMEERV